MRHKSGHRKLGRTSEHRMATLRSLSTELIKHDRITTTLAKAKEMRPFAEKLITKAKLGDLHSRRIVAKHIHDSDVLKKLFETIGPRFADRPGGYLRITKLGSRRGDSAEMAVIELMDQVVAAKPAKNAEKKAKKTEETTEETVEAASEDAVEAAAEETTEAAEEATDESTDDAADEPAEEDKG